MNAPATEQATIPVTAGTPYAGGIYAGRFFIGTTAYALIIASKDEGELEDVQWGNSKKDVSGATSWSDGFANTEAMAAAGSKTGKWARALRLGGFDDWYLPSRIEALIAFAEVRDKFGRDWYWTSTQHADVAEGAWGQYFHGGYQYYYRKSYKLRARAVRRVPI